MFIFGFVSVNRLWLFYYCIQNKNRTHLVTENKYGFLRIIWQPNKQFKYYK